MFSHAHCLLTGMSSTSDWPNWWLVGQHDHFFWNFLSYRIWCLCTCVFFGSEIIWSLSIMNHYSAKATARGNHGGCLSICLSVCLSVYLLPWNLLHTSFICWEQGVKGLFMVFSRFLSCGFSWKCFVQKFWHHLPITTAVLASWWAPDGQKRQWWLLFNETS